MQYRASKSTVCGHKGKKGGEMTATWFDLRNILFSAGVPIFGFVSFWGSAAAGVILSLKDKKTAVAWVGMTATAALLLGWCGYVVR
jgi:hypothetical protein